jgi:hypothetical protein
LLFVSFQQVSRVALMPTILGTVLSDEGERNRQPTFVKKVSTLLEERSAAAWFSDVDTF